MACQFGVMFFPDRVQGYREAHRVLKPGGRFFFNVWDHISKNEFADVVTQALAKLFPQDPPRSWPAPHMGITRCKDQGRACCRGVYLDA